VPIPDSPTPQQAAIGFRVHSGWAVVVAVAGTGGSPRIVLRKRIELITPDIPKQPYHAAVARGLKAAEDFIERSRAAVNCRAQEEVGALKLELKAQGLAVTGVGVLLASGRPLGTLAQILASHAAIHAAEGEFFRNAVMEASRHCELAVTGVKERELFDKASAELHKPAEEIQRRLTELGAPLGAPWRIDEKLSALIAWLVLAEQLKT
jgi:hypothetical protein